MRVCIKAFSFIDNCIGLNWKVLILGDQNIELHVLHCYSMSFLIQIIMMTSLHLVCKYMVWVCRAGRVVDRCRVWRRLIPSCAVMSGLFGHHYVFKANYALTSQRGIGSWFVVSFDILLMWLSRKDGGEWASVSSKYAQLWMIFGCHVGCGCNRVVRHSRRASLAAALMRRHLL